MDSFSLDSGEKWSLMEDLFRFAWFRRVWTLQEIVLNSEDAIVHCGDQTIEWRQIMSAMKCMRECMFDHYSVLDEAMGTITELRSKVQQWRSAWSSGLLPDLPFLKFNPIEGPRPRLAEILACARSRESSEPRDKAYGVYAICQFLDIYMPPPRYEQSVEQIFFEMTRSIIESENDLSVLYEVDGPNRNHNLPSWVPDWEHGWTRKYGAPITHADAFHAGGNIALFFIDPELKLLRLKCKIIDVVFCVGESIPVFEKMPIFSALEINQTLYPAAMDDSWQVWQIFREWAQCVRQHYPGIASALEQFRSTVLQGSHICAKDRDPWHPEPGSDGTTKAAFERWYTALLETTDKVQKEVRQDLKEMMNRVWYMRSIFGDASDPAVRVFHFRAWLLSRGKCFFITENSRMGTGQGKISQGDVIAIVAGLNMPLVLTPVGNHFRLAGHIYVPGIMYGEAWPDQHSELSIICVE